MERKEGRECGFVILMNWVTLNRDCRMFVFWWQWLVLNCTCSETASKYLLYFYCSGLEDRD